MLIDEGLAPQGYYDQQGLWHFYDPERALLTGRLKLAGVGACRSCQRGMRGRGLGVLGEPYDTLVVGVGAAIGVGTIVYLLMKKIRRRR